MKLFILTSYSAGLNDPLVSFSYEDIYRKMEKSFHTALDGIEQTTDEKENTSLDTFSATAVISGDWIEWAITEVELPLSDNFPAPTDRKSNAGGVKPAMTDLKLDIWNEWLREKQGRLEETLRALSPEDSPPDYYRIAGHIDGMMDALTMLTTVEDGKRFRKKLDTFRKKLLQTGDYDADGNEIPSGKKQ